MLCWNRLYGYDKISLTFSDRRHRLQIIDQVATLNHRLQKNSERRIKLPPELLQAIALPVFVLCCLASLNIKEAFNVKF